MPRLSVPADHPHRREISKLENSFNASLIRALDKQRRDLMRGITAETISRLPAMLNDENIVTPLQNAIERMLLQIAESGASVGIDEIDNEIARITKADIGINWELVNEAVATWARTYAHDLVTGINTTTSRKLTRQIIAFSESPDMTMKQLAANIAPIFGADRASNIAVTETTRAYAQGNMQAWENSGVTEGIRWNTANDERVCPICGPLNQVVVSRGEMFPGNIDNPPAHPRCRCWVTPVVDMEKIETDFVNITSQLEPNKTWDSVKDAEQWAIDRGYNADFTGMSKPQAQSVTNAIERLENKFTGSYKPKSGGIKIGNKAGSEAAAFVGEGNTIYIVPDRFNPTSLGLNERRDILENLEKARALLEESKIVDDGGWSRDRALKRIARYEKNLKRLDDAPWMVGETMDDIVLHEFGHAIESDLSFSDEVINGIIDFRMSDERERLGMSFEDSIVSQMDNIATNEGLKISEYATTNAPEYFAEAFTAFMRGEEDKINNRLLGIFKRMVK